MSCSLDRERRVRVLAIPALGLALALTSCSSPSDEGASSGAGGRGVGGIVIPGNSNDFDAAGGILLGGNACIAEPLQGEPLPVDIYIMFDQSGSMATPVGAGTRLDAVRSAVGNFLGAPDSRGLGVGIGYFGKFPIGNTSCDPADYAAPAVPIGMLPGVATSVLDSLARIVPTGETPTGAAIRGACSYAQSYRGANLGHAVFLLLVTDGVPEAPVSMAHGCAPTLADAVAATTSCRDGATPIKTYVIGVGPSLQNLAQITQAGGTDKTYLVEGGNVSDEVLAALNEIRLAATIRCELKIPAPPAGKVLDFGLVNLLYTNSQKQRTQLYNTGGPAGCAASGGGWYYDDPANPQKIVLCESTCSTVKYEIGGELDYAIGCKTLIPPPR